MKKKRFLRFRPTPTQAPHAPAAKPICRIVTKKSPAHSAAGRVEQRSTNLNPTSANARMPTRRLLVLAPNSLTIVEATRLIKSQRYCTSWPTGPTTKQRKTPRTRHDYQKTDKTLPVEGNRSPWQARVMGYRRSSWRSIGLYDRSGPKPSKECAPALGGSTRAILASNRRIYLELADR